MTVSNTTARSNADELSKEELRAQISALTSQVRNLTQTKKFGLVWENKPDAQVLRLTDEAPMLFEDTSKAVVTDENAVNHILINGDNFHALTALRASHLNKVDVIYIDPPYNTGNKDFIYNDSYLDKDDGYLHSKWLSFMEKRLKLARELLSETGVIFVSIDENEQARLKLLMDEVFGPKNFVDMFSWMKTSTPANLAVKTKKAMEYILCYQKTKTKTPFTGLKKESQSSNGLMNQTNKVGILKFPSKYTTCGLKDGVYAPGKYGTSSYVIELLDEVTVKDGRFSGDFRLKGKFKWTQRKLDEENSLGTLIAIRTLSFSPSYERSDYGEEAPWNIIDSRFGVSTNEVANTALKKILGNGKFSYPKPVDLLYYVLGFTIKKNPNAIILDFFAGSGTTAHAVAEINKSDGGRRQCILVTDGGKVETTGESSKNAKGTDVNIAEEVTYERVRRVLTGKDWADGKEREPLGGNLRYFNVEMNSAEHFKEIGQMGDSGKYTSSHASIAENVFTLVSEKSLNDTDEATFLNYKVLSAIDEDVTCYVVAVENHDCKMRELREWFESLPDGSDITIIGRNIESVDWVQRNLTTIKVRDLMAEVYESRRYVATTMIH